MAAGSGCSRAGGAAASGPTSGVSAGEGAAGASGAADGAGRHRRGGEQVRPAQHVGRVREPLAVELLDRRPAALQAQRLQRGPDVGRRPEAGVVDAGVAAGPRDAEQQRARVEQRDLVTLAEVAVGGDQPRDLPDEDGQPGDPAGLEAGPAQLHGGVHAGPHEPVERGGAPAGELEGLAGTRLRGDGPGALGGRRHDAGLPERPRRSGRRPDPPGRRGRRRTTGAARNRRRAGWRPSPRPGPSRRCPSGSARRRPRVPPPSSGAPGSGPARRPPGGRDLGQSGRGRRRAAPTGATRRRRLPRRYVIRPAGPGLPRRSAGIRRERRPARPAPARRRRVHRASQALRESTSTAVHSRPKPTATGSADHQFQGGSRPRNSWTKPTP